jgi:hypothetical protein
MALLAAEGGEKFERLHKNFSTLHKYINLMKEKINI